MAEHISRGGRLLPLLIEGGVVIDQRASIASIHRRKLENRWREKWNLLKIATPRSHQKGLEDDKMYAHASTRKNYIKAKIYHTLRVVAAREVEKAIFK